MADFADFMAKWQPAPGHLERPRLRPAGAGAARAAPRPRLPLVLPRRGLPLPLQRGGAPRSVRRALRPRRREDDVARRRGARSSACPARTASTAARSRGCSTPARSRRCAATACPTSRRRRSCSCATGWSSGDLDRDGYRHAADRPAGRAARPTGASARCSTASTGGGCCSVTELPRRGRLGAAAAAPRVLRAADGRRSRATLLGKLLVRRRRRWARRASRASSRSRPTSASATPPRTRAAGPPRAPRSCSARPGFLYVYLIYGMHHCMNFVTETDGVAGAVLLRAAAPLVGTCRDLSGPLTGPGKLCPALAITRATTGSISPPAATSTSPTTARRRRAGPRLGAHRRRVRRRLGRPQAAVLRPRATPTSAKAERAWRLRTSRSIAANMLGMRGGDQAVGHLAQHEPGHRRLHVERDAVVDGRAVPFGREAPAADRSW